MYLHLSLFTNIRYVLLLIFLPIVSFSQNTIGLPNINNFSKSSYKAGLQNWEIKQDKNGIIYVANNEGLLTFDGKYWDLLPLPNKTIVRSVAISDDNKIYVGGQDELGYFYPNEHGKLIYHSILHLIPQKDRLLGDLWEIKIIKDNVFFRSFSKIIKFNKKNTVVYNAPKEWSFMGIGNETLFVQDRESGIYTYENEIFKPFILNNPIPKGSEITSLLSISATEFIISTLKNGLFNINNHQLKKISTSILDVIEKFRIYDATLINNNTIALATSYNGVYIINQQGNFIQNFTRVQGLQNNNVLSIFLDKQKNLWLGLDNGIDCIEYNSAVKKINPSSQGASGYTALLHNGIFYAGTSSGLFSVSIQNEKDFSFSKGTFIPVPKAMGQIWSLAEINNQVLIGQHEGASVIKNNMAYSLNTNAGFWNFIATDAIYPTQKVIAGNYFGLQFFNYNNNEFVPAQIIPEFKESSRFVTIDKFNNVWVSHPYHGVFKLIPEANGKYLIKQYTHEHGLPSINNNHVYKIQNEILIATEKGIYTYDKNTDRFIASDFYTKILGEQSIRYLREDTEGNIWFIHDKSVSVIDDPYKNPNIIHIPELSNRILSGFEFIYPINKNNIIIGSENGFFNIDFEKYSNNNFDVKIQLRNVIIRGSYDSLIYGGYDVETNNSSKKITTINKKWNNILFEYASPLFGQQVNLEYSFRLNGYLNNWSDWNTKTEKEFNNLPSGTYTFEVKARNNLGIESSVVSYSFNILPPWYKSKMAYFIYFLIFCASIYFFIEKQRNIFYLQELKYEKEQKELQDQHEREIKEAESELVALRNEKLQADVDFKNSELANSAMHILKKGELLTKIKTELHQIIKKETNEKTIAELKKMLKALNEDEKMDEDWEHFAQHFDKVHSDFVYTLKDKFPTITPNELKLSAYLRMNLSTKEIAQLMNISVRGVEISRYRLRKKLGISSEVNLFDFLMNLNHQIT
jgi:ligand-binding sensor domain-containing protein/DNA-binding CsgD family transcriptional regulator